MRWEVRSIDCCWSPGLHLNSQFRTRRVQHAMRCVSEANGRAVIQVTNPFALVGFRLAVVASGMVMTMRLIGFAWLLSFSLLGTGCSNTAEDGRAGGVSRAGLRTSRRQLSDEVCTGSRQWDRPDRRRDRHECDLAQARSKCSGCWLAGSLVTLAATTEDRATTCEGSSRFDVLDGVATEVEVMPGSAHSASRGGSREWELNLCAALTR